MDISQDSFEQIDRFLNGEMNGEEKSAFLDQLQNNTALSKAVKLQYELRNSIKAKSLEPLENRLKMIRDKVKFEQDSKKRKPFFKTRSIFWIAGIAASFLLLLGLFVYQKSIENRQNEVAEEEMKKKELKKFEDYNSSSDDSVIVSNKFDNDKSMNLGSKNNNSIINISVNPIYINSKKIEDPKIENLSPINILISPIKSDATSFYSFTESSLKLYVPNPSVFKNKIALIAFENKDGVIIMYLNHGDSLYKITETSSKLPLSKEENDEVRNSILKGLK